MLSYRSACLLCTLLLVASRPAAAGNLLLLGQFDQPSAIDGWTVTTDGGEGSLSFEAAVDEASCAGSGSALLVTSSPGDRDVVYSACAPGIVGGGDYAFGLEVSFPDGEGKGWLFWGVTWLDGPDCSGSVLNSTWIGPVGYAPDWQAVELWITTQPATASALVELWVSSLEAPVPLHLNIDRVFVRPLEELFADDFELGELCRWTTV